MENKAIDFVKNVGKQTISFYGISKVPFLENLGKSGGVIQRNVSRGTLWYVSNEAVEQLTTGSSNLTKMDIKVLIDDVFFNSLSSLVIEQAGLYRPVYSAVQSISPSNEITDALATGLIVASVNEAGKYFESSLIKNISDKLGFSF